MESILITRKWVEGRLNISELSVRERERYLFVYLASIKRSEMALFCKSNMVKSHIDGINQERITSSRYHYVMDYLREVSNLTSKGIKSSSHLEKNRNDDFILSNDNLEEVKVNFIEIVKPLLHPGLGALVPKYKKKDLYLKLIEDCYAQNVILPSVSILKYFVDESRHENLIFFFRFMNFLS